MQEPPVKQIKELVKETVNENYEELNDLKDHTRALLADPGQDVDQRTATGCLLEIARCDSLEVCSKRAAVNTNFYSKKSNGIKKYLDGDTQH